MKPSRYRGTEKTQKEVNAVLDKIRAEIEQKYNDCKMRDDYEEAYGLEEALMVIDRHMKGDMENEV